MFTCQFLNIFKYSCSFNANKNTKNKKQHKLYKEILIIQIFHTLEYLSV